MVLVSTTMITTRHGKIDSIVSTARSNANGFLFYNERTIHTRIAIDRSGRDVAKVDVAVASVANSRAGSAGGRFVGGTSFDIRVEG